MYFRQALSLLFIVCRRKTDTIAVGAALLPFRRLTLLGLVSFVRIAVRYVYLFLCTQSQIQLTTILFSGAIVAAAAFGIGTHECIIYECGALGVHWRDSSSAANKSAIGNGVWILIINVVAFKTDNKTLLETLPSCGVY